MAAYQNPLRVQPSNSSQAPFILGSGQQVEVSSNIKGPITAVGQTTGGSTYVSPNGKDINGTVGGKQILHPIGWRWKRSFPQSQIETASGGLMPLQAVEPLRTR